MCGLVGYIDNKDEETKKATIKKMSDVIAHRGPDGEGFFVDDTIAMGFRRLSIIDLAGGNQPLYNEDKTLVINFNGEIYNYLELREELKKKGHIFKTNSDTEVIVHGYEEYGEKVLQKLRGMFGFVIWDTKKKELFGARDPFGIKPFYYYKEDGLFIYGSEIKAFLAHPDFKKELNDKALKSYLTFQYSPLNETFFKNVFKLNPGHFIKVKDGSVKIERYFDIQYQNGSDSLEQTVDNINNVMKDSIEHHKISDVEVGAFLSSGVDSSYIVTNAKVDKTFTVGFENDGFDETSDAKDLCKILNMKNKSEIITSDMFFDILPSVQYYSDEPHANLSAVPLYYLARMASKEVKVVLSGEGADELFGGYVEYDVPDEYQRYRKVPMCIRRPLKAFAKTLPNIKGRHFLIKGGSTLEDSYIGQAFIMDNEEANDLLTEKYKTDIRFQDLTKSYYGEVKDKDEILKKMYLDMKLWLPYDILLKADKMTMASSLELRVPFLDKEVYKVSERVPVKYIIHDHITKYAFRKAATKSVPEEWSKRKKLGFMVPFKKWILEDRYYDKVKEVFEEDWVKEFFDQDKILKLLQDHHDGKWNNARKVYTIYCFLIWYKIYFRNELQEAIAR